MREGQKKMKTDEAYQLYHSGQKAMEKDNIPLAIGSFRQSMALEPHFKTAELLGECLLGHGKPTEAILYLAAACGLGTNAFRAKFLLAKAYMAVDDEDEAIHHLEDALAMNPDYKDARKLHDEISSKAA